MKKIFAFAIALVAMATSMVSCNNDNADFIEQKAPVAPNTTQVESKAVTTSFDGKLYFGASDDQLEYVNNIYNVTVNGETVEVNVANLPTTTDVPFANELSESLKKANATFYVYQVPTNAKGSIRVTCNFSIKEGVELPETITFVEGAAIYRSNLIGAQNNLISKKLESLLTKYNTLTDIHFAIK